MSDVITKNNLLAGVDYSMFNLDDITSYVSGLNCKFYIDEEAFEYLLHVDLNLNHQLKIII